MKAVTEVERLRQSIAMGVRFENKLMAENDELREQLRQLQKELKETKEQLQYYIMLSVKEVS